jgi:hypothetical protein
MQHDTSTDSSKKQPTPAPRNGHSQYRLQQHATSDSNWVINYKPITKMKLIFNINGNAP